MGSALALGRAHRADPPLAKLPADVLSTRSCSVSRPRRSLRLRLVCRSWYSITSDPGFITAHLSRHPSIAGLRRLYGDEIQAVDVYSGDIAKRIRGLGLSPLGLNLSKQDDLVYFAVANTDFHDGKYFVRTRDMPTS
ncbi:unnamed protein product [Urochloa humidicola]